MNTFQLFPVEFFSCGVGSLACVARQIFSICNVRGDYPRWMRDGIKQIIQLLASYIWSEAKRPGPPGPGQIGFGMGGNKGGGAWGGGGWGVGLYHWNTSLYYYGIIFSNITLLYYGMNIVFWRRDFPYIPYQYIIYKYVCMVCESSHSVLLFQASAGLLCLGHCASRFMFQIKFLKSGQHFSITDLEF